MQSSTFCDVIYDIFWLHIFENHTIDFLRIHIPILFLANLKNGSTRCKIWKSKLEILLPILNDIDWILFQKKNLA